MSIHHGTVGSAPPGTLITLDSAAGESTTFERVIGHRYTTQTSWTTGQAITWNATYPDDGVGGVWNGASTAFIIPHTGMYHVSASIILNAAGAERFMTLNNSTSGVMDAHYAQGASGVTSCKCTYVGTLTTADEISVQLINIPHSNPGSPYNTSGWNHLSVVRLY